MPFRTKHFAKRPNQDLLMSQKTPDKETYSVDDMMERLRKGERKKESEGELVTREDGTQVLRVKKRKRRSKQKKEEEAKRRRRAVLLRTFALVAIPLILGLSLVYLLAKYHSPGFAEGINAAIWEKTGSQARISRLSPVGTKLSARAMTLSWPDDSYLDKLQVQQVSGDLSPLAFLTGNFGGDELTSAQGHLLTSNRVDRKISQPPGDARSLSGFESYTCNSFSFFFGNLKSPFRLENTRAEFIPTAYSRQLSLSGGDFFVKSWGTLPFLRGTLEFLNETIKVISLRFEEKDRSLILSGNILLSDSLHSLTVEVVEGTIGNVGGYGLEHLIQSELTETTGTLAFRPWNVDTHEMILSCKPEYLTVKNFSFLNVLEELYGNDTFEEFEFEPQNQFEIIRNAEGVEIRDLDLVELGVFALKGKITVIDDKLGGIVRVGLPDHKRLTIRESQRTALFAQSKLEDGFFWFDVTLSGSPEDPEDNFENYLEEGEPKSNLDLFEQLTR